MSTSSTNIRIDDEVKKQAQKLFSEFGLDMTTAVNMFLRQAIRQQAIPFPLALNVPNAETIAAMQEGERILANPASKRFSSVEDLFKELDAE